MIDRLIRTDFKLVDKRDETRKVLGFLAGDDDAPVPIVCDEGKPYGILNARALLRKGLNPNEHLENKVIGIRQLTPQDSVEEALDVVAGSKVPVVPVVDSDDETKVIGYVHAADLLGEIQHDARADNLMEGVPVMRESDMTGEFVHHFQRVRPDVLPVADAQGHLVGAVTRSTAVALVADAMKDGRKSVVGERVERGDQPLEGYVEANQPSVATNAPFHEVVDKLQRFGYAFVVDDDNHVRGIVTPEEVASRVARGGTPRSSARPGARS